MNSGMWKLLIITLKASYIPKPLLATCSITTHMIAMPFSLSIYPILAIAHMSFVK